MSRKHSYRKGDGKKEVQISVYKLGKDQDKDSDEHNHPKGSKSSPHKKMRQRMFTEEILKDGRKIRREVSYNNQSEISDEFNI